MRSPSTFLGSLLLTLQAQAGDAFGPYYVTKAAASSSTCRHAASSPVNGEKFSHAMAILAMPYTSLDRIANELILQTVLPRTDKLSVVLRCEGSSSPSLARLRQYVGEVYSQLWDCCVQTATDGRLPDVVVYPQNLPNTAPEAWIDIQPDLAAVCSHDSLTGWVSEAANGRGKGFQAKDGLGGLASHVAALNAERKSRNLKPVVVLPVDESQWPDICQDTVIFVDDDPKDFHRSPLWQAMCLQLQQQDDDEERTNGVDRDVAEYSNGKTNGDAMSASKVFLGGARMPINQQMLFDSVCVGGTFDGLHFGHRKLLTLAVSSVNPLTGRLLVGVTVDAMLRKKKYAEFMPKFEERCAGVRNFLSRLAPGMMNRVQIVPISDAFGPPGQKDYKFTFDALVLSHETLETGHALNRHRENVGLPPLKLLCTRRTEAHGMSSTVLRKLRSEQAQATKAAKVI